MRPMADGKGAAVVPGMPAVNVAGVVGVVLATKTGRGGGMSAAGILFGLGGTFIDLGYALHR